MLSVSSAVATRFLDYTTFSCIIFKLEKNLSRTSDLE